jgi:hypothetical protein
LNKLFENLGFSVDFDLTEQYYSEDSYDFDYRDKIHPKIAKNAIDLNFRAVEYYQVFSNKYGFVENLSILDLLFNEGPLAIQTLRKSIVK